MQSEPFTLTIRECHDCGEKTQPVWRETTLQTLNGDVNVYGLVYHCSKCDIDWHDGHWSKISHMAMVQQRQIWRLNNTIERVKHLLENILDNKEQENGNT